MTLLIAFAALAGFVALIIWMVKSTQEPTIADSAKQLAKKKENEQQDERKNRPEQLKNFNLPPIPQGHQIYLKRAYVAGAQHFSDQVWRLTNQDTPTLSWKSDPDNPHDKNAIQIFAGSGEHKEAIGFVDRELAAVVTHYENKDELDIRFAGANVDEKWVEVFYQITGPKQTKQAFREFYEQHA